MSASFEEFKKVCKRVCGLKGTPACKEESCLFIIHRDLVVVCDFEEIKKSLGVVSPSKAILGKEATLYPLPDSDYTNELFIAPIPDLTQKSTNNITVKYEKLKEETIMSSVQKIVDGYFGEEITIDANQVVDAFEKYRKKKVKPISRVSGTCPRCNETIYTTDNYCSNCGQHLDWSDNDARTTT
jgi:hypothetical protein